MPPGADCFSNFPECSVGPLKTRKLVEMGRQGRPPHSPLGNGVLALAQRLLGEVVLKNFSRHRKWVRGGACESSRVSASHPAASCLLIRWTAVSRETHVLTPPPASRRFGSSSSMARESALGGRHTFSQFPSPFCCPASQDCGGEGGGA